MNTQQAPQFSVLYYLKDGTRVYQLRVDGKVYFGYGATLKEAVADALAQAIDDREGRD